MSASTISRDVQAFATAVRAQLDDLPPDDVDDLTEGLEADLAESIAEARSGADGRPDLGAGADGQSESGADTRTPAEATAAHLGDPVTYAAELRAAAGFAPRISGSRRLGAGNLSSWFEKLRATFMALGTSTKTGVVVWSFLVAIRPLWWVARGWAIFQLFVALTLGFGHTEIWPNNPILGLLQIAALVLSVQWGRGRLLSGALLRRTKTVATIVAVIALPFLLGALRPAYDVQYVESAAEPTAGLSQNGRPIGNIFAYDSTGAPVTGVQLFDQDGTPLAIASAGDTEVGYFQYFLTDGVPRYALPSDSVPGRDGWNVYPLREVAEGDVDFSTYPVSIDSSKVTMPSAPFVRVQPLTELKLAEMSPVSPSPSPSPVPDPSPSPSGTPLPSPSPSP